MNSKRFMISPPPRRAQPRQRSTCALAILISLGFAISVLAQGPAWLVPRGATVSQRGTELPSPPPTPPSPQAHKSPARLPAPTTAATRSTEDHSLPVRHARTENPLALPQTDAKIKAGRDVGNSTVVAEEVSLEICRTKRLDLIPTTTLDRNAFDLSLKTSLASFRSSHSGAACDISLSRSCETGCTPTYYDDFSPTPMGGLQEHTCGEQWVYDSKRDVPTQRPWVEWGRVFYGDGITPRGRNWFGEKNLARPQLYVYGDYRTGIAAGRNANGRTDNWAHRLNLDVDFQLTDTERFHTFIGPLDNGAEFTRVELVQGDLKGQSEIDFTPLTGFFEGDLGVLMGAAGNRTSPFELPFTIGLVPLLFQNGIWMEDAVTGAAFALPARHSRLLNWSNYDATFFAVVDQLNSPAFGNDKHAAQAFGTAWFIEAYHGYIEAGYAYVRDRNVSDRSYHNITASYTRRYFDRISNSLRVIVNTGQDLPDAARTADGVLLLVENSWITSSPLTVVPYANFFVGWDRPQSVARAGVSGGILRNTGINFDTDGLNGLATLDTTASDTAGGSLGIDLLGKDLDRQLLLEATYLTPHGSKNAAVPGDQFAVGARYQFPISHCTLLRMDTMYGWRRGLVDVYGTRMEYRWKF